MRQPLVSSFRFSGPQQTNLNDVGLCTGPGCTTSNGATLIDEVNFGTGPGLGQSWEILSVSIQAYLTIANVPQGGTPGIFGQLGRLYGGVLVNIATETVGAAPQFQVYWDQVMHPLPYDPTLMIVLFDPANDPLPPISHLPANPPNPSQQGTVATPSQALPVSGTILPPNPIQLTPGVQPSLSIGLWLEPSELGCTPGASSAVGLNVQFASYTVTYDDGL